MSIELTESAMNVSTVKPQKGPDNVQKNVSTPVSLEAEIINRNTADDTNKSDENIGVTPLNQQEVVNKKEEMTTPQLENVAKQLQEFIGKMNRGLEFTVDEDSGRDVIKVIDKSSGDIIKQYPSEEVLSLVAKLSEATGNFVDSKI